MKKIFVALLLCLALLAMLPAAYGAESSPASPQETSSPQETQPTEETDPPSFNNPRPEKVDD